MPDNDNELPRTRAEAKAIGSKRYFTGKPCKYGHVAERWTGDGQCYVCARAKALAKFVANREERNEYKRKKAKQKYAENPEYRKRSKEYHKERMKNPDSLFNKRAADKRRRDRRTEDQRQLDRIYMRQYQKALCDSSPKARVNRSISSGIRSSIQEGAKAGRKWESLVGYTVSDLMSHLESLFLEGMSWDNYGRNGWHIDHKIPKSAFNYETPEDIDFRRCWSLSNLQPLWESDNIKKGNKISCEFQPSLAIAEAANNNTLSKETA